MLFATCSGSNIFDLLATQNNTEVLEMALEAAKKIMKTIELLDLLRKRNSSENNFWFHAVRANDEFLSAFWRYCEENFSETERNALTSLQEVERKALHSENSQSLH